MRITFAVLAPLWLYQISLTNRMIEWHEKMIGGAAYFDHMGIGNYIAALRLLIPLAVLISVLLIAATLTPKIPSRVIFLATSAYSIIAVIVWFPALSHFSLIGTMMFPLDMSPDIYLMLGLATATLLATYSAALIAHRKSSNVE